jgi:hypothetical protein
MNGEIPTPVVEKLKQRAELNEASEQASRVPLPGPTLAAMLPEDIKVTVRGKSYSFRPMYDFDFTVLQDLNHPLCAQAIEGKNWAESPANLRGPDAWNVIWILSRPIAEVKKAWRDKTLLTQAESEFGETMRIKEVVELLKGALQQYAGYFDTQISFEAAESEGEPAQPTEKKSA